MTHGEVPGGGEQGYEILPRETVELTLKTSDGDQLHLDYANTSVFYFVDDPDVNCIEIIETNEEPVPNRIHRLFQREDMESALVSLGFRAVYQRYASKEQTDAYVSWVTEDAEEQWVLLDQEGGPLEASDQGNLPEPSDIERLSPVVELPIPGGEVLQANLDNTQLFRIAQFPDMSHVYVHGIHPATGEPYDTYIFDNSDLLDELEAQGFSTTTQRYPSLSDETAYRNWVSQNIDRTISNLLGGEDLGGGSAT